MDHVIKTGLDIETQKSTLDKAFDEQLRKYPQYKPEFHWAKDVEGTEGRFSFRPTPSLLVAGKLHVTEGQIGIEFTALPFLAKMFKGKAIEMVEKEVQIWVEKAKSAASS